MSRSGKLFIVIVVSASGLWGCAQGPANSSAQSERLRTLEAKCAKFEDDYRAVAAARDAARKSAAVLEQDRDQLAKEKAILVKEAALKAALVKERAELCKQIEARTNERDQIALRCEKLKKGIQSVLGQDDGPGISTATPSSASASEASAIPGGKLQ